MPPLSPHNALIRLLSIVLTVAAPGLVSAEVSPRQMVGGQLLRAAITLVETQPLTVEALGTAVVLVEEAFALNPQDVELCRLLYRFADLAENEEARGHALGRLVVLDPQDDVARLMFVNAYVDRYQTVEGRLAAYEKLLAEPTRTTLGSTVASRLANDYAWLLDRTGDIDGFARWVAEAVALDPSNRTAAATAAGFFRMNVAEDPFAEAELLTTLLLADPTSVETQTVLARLLIENGAYVGADRLYDLAARSSEARRAPPAGGLVADRIVAQWGRGDVTGALATVQLRQREADETYRANLRAQYPDLTAVELARRHGPIVVTLATARAAILDRTGDRLAGAALDSALAAYDVLIGGLKDQGDIEAQVIAQLGLEAAFVTLWLDGDIDRAQGYLDNASAIFGEQTMSDDARLRFEGWVALRRGEVSRAVDLLQPIAVHDAGAQLGMALCHLAEGKQRDAARSLNDVATRRRGTVVGMWAQDTLRELLGRPLPIGETARKLEQLIASIPRIVDRLPEEPTLAVSVRVQPTKTTFGPYEPVIVNVEISNNASFPLAIDPRGPIKSQVALTLKVQIARLPETSKLRPMVVDLDRRLRLEPHERLVIPVDLRRGSLAQVLNRWPLRGATLKVTATMAFYVASAESIQPGILGSDVASAPFRVDGVRLSPKWISSAIADVLSQDAVKDLETFALLSQLVFMVTRLREGPESALEAVDKFGDPQRMAEDIAAAIIHAYGTLDAISRAWVLGAMVRTPALEPVYLMAQKDDDKLVRIAYLLYCLTGPDDPMIDAARRGDDANVRLVAETMHAVIVAASATQ
ncbi:MAG: hypothetical protein V3S08_05535 [Phycisphaerales bacterium]